VNVSVVVAALLGLIQPAEHLDQLGCEAARQELPILLYVSRSDCSFCMRLEKDILGPLLKSGTLDDKILLRELESDNPAPIVDFAGHQSTAAKVAEAYRATITPTLLFLDSAGQEVERRIVGYQPSDFYSYYLETAATRAGERLGERFGGPSCSEEPAAH
jgi:thioredoxin-related protein